MAREGVVMGQCRLCLLDHVALKDSHFLSKGIYKILRDATAKNPNPFLVTEKTSVQTSRQLRRHLFCDACEKRLNTGGERWVLSNCLQSDGRFPLAELLGQRTPTLRGSDNPTKIYHANTIPEIEISDLAYFAASIFWRGSLYPWNNDGSIPVELGPFQEQFRRYLMREKPFPNDACLWVAIREGKEFNRLTRVPTLARVDGLHAYTFPMPGLAFTLIVSKHIPAKYRQLCIAHGAGNPIVVTSILEGWIAQAAATLLHATKGYQRRATES